MTATPESILPTVVEFPITADVLAVADKAREFSLCEECFGRMFGRYGHGLSNPERARQVSSIIQPAPKLSAGQDCELCRGLFDRWTSWVDRVDRASESIEWTSFSCGSRWDPEILAHEELIWSRVGTAWGESARTAFNRELGKRVEARSGRRGGSGPSDVLFVADLPVGRVELTVHPIYLKGRYRKLDRTIPQTRWPCRACRGRGCVRCGETGKMYPTSVEELIAGPVLRATDGRGTRFHGMGREDIDARMLGEGRPFVLEILSPRHRSVDPALLTAEIGTEAAGRVEVLEFSMATPLDVARVKDGRPAKSYRVVVRGDVSREKVNEALTVAVGGAIAQRTPTRVAHRRSDRVRTRRIVAAELIEAGEGRFTLELRAEAGTYIKEWVEGDGGRTVPSLSHAVGVTLAVESLDVIGVHDREA